MRFGRLATATLVLLCYSLLLVWLLLLAATAVLTTAVTTAWAVCSDHQVKQIRKWGEDYPSNTALVMEKDKNSRYASCSDYYIFPSGWLGPGIH